MLHRYGDTDVREMLSSCGSTYCTHAAWCVILKLCRAVLELIAKLSHAVAHVLCKVLVTLRTIPVKLV